MTTEYTHPEVPTRGVREGQADPEEDPALVDYAPRLLAALDEVLELAGGTHARRRGQNDTRGGVVPRVDRAVDDGQLGTRRRAVRRPPRVRDRAQGPAQRLSVEERGRPGVPAHPETGPGRSTRRQVQGADRAGPGPDRPRRRGRRGGGPADHPPVPAARSRRGQRSGAVAQRRGRGAGPPGGVRRMGRRAGKRPQVRADQERAGTAEGRGQARQSAARCRRPRAVQALRLHRGVEAGGAWRAAHNARTHS